MKSAAKKSCPVVCDSLCVRLYVWGVAKVPSPKPSSTESSSSLPSVAKSISPSPLKSA